ncbi:MAG: hypothetical protein G3M70_16390 [Candidatus Nitronauta litoralis]|uniref:Uncharacterized protein n=1 Tax=Candidatus Nitronauta litoralis TaxID=2705533 RepID=A0A7T0BYN0_9BACT|nr:MAG: hypothetical protein G3M70_16390 [Candidatus Nitronauta litoralis]
MMQLTHVKYGILIAMIAILFGGSMGLSFGCCEDDVKGFLKSQAESVFQEKYGGEQTKKDKVVNKAWVYMKRAHLHSQTMGVIAIAFSLLVAWLNFHPKIQLGVSLLSGLGSLGYGIFWLLAGGLAPGMGGTHSAKEAVGLIAQLSGGAFFVSGVTVFAILAYKMFVNRQKESIGNS